MNARPHRAAVLGLITLLAACSGTGTPIPSSQGQTPGLASAPASNEYLFTATSTSIAEYAPGATAPMRRIKSFAESLLIDSTGTLYAASFDENRIRAFLPGSRALERTIAMTGPQSMAVDSLGNLYVSNSGAFTGCPAKPAPAGIVNLYLPHAITPARTIAIAPAHGWALGLDASGDLFVGEAVLHANNATCPPGISATNTAIAIYEPGATVPQRVVSKGISGIPGERVDAAGGIYVPQNGQGCPTCKASYTITYYAPHQSSPTKVTKLAASIAGIALNAAGELYVAENPTSHCVIEVFAPKGGALKKRVVTPVSYCLSFALDRESDLYLEGLDSHGYAFVTELAGDSGKTLRTIQTPGLLSMAIGPR